MCCGLRGASVSGETAPILKAPADRRTESSICPGLEFQSNRLAGLWSRQAPRCSENSTTPPPPPPLPAPPLPAPPLPAPTQHTLPRAHALRLLRSSGGHRAGLLLALPALVVPLLLPPPLPFLPLPPLLLCFHLLNSLLLLLHLLPPRPTFRQANSTREISSLSKGMDSIPSVAPTSALLSSLPQNSKASRRIPRAAALHHTPAAFRPLPLIYCPVTSSSLPVLLQLRILSVCPACYCYCYCYCRRRRRRCCCCCCCHSHRYCYCRRQIWQYDDRGAL
jgi:hypothetical protein